MFRKILAAFITIILFFLLFAQVPIDISERLIDTLWPIGHIASFTFWAWLLISFNPAIKNSSSKHQFIILSLTALIVGGGIELLQPLFSRSAQLSDLYYNLYGTFGGFLFFGNFKQTKKRLFAIRVSYLILFLYLMLPAIQTIKDEYEIRIDFPVIAKFNSSSELTRWKADLPLSIVNSNVLAESASADINLMKATFAEKMDSRVVLRFFAGNWQGYKQIKFSFFNPNQEALKVRLIITDQNYDKSTSENHTSNRNDRFGEWLIIDSGWNDYYVDLADIENAPTERVMDLSNIAGVDFYMYQLNKPINLYIRRIELISK